MLGRTSRRALVLALGLSTLGAAAASTALAAPVNDNFANRVTIGPALPINNVAGTTVDATDEAGEPDHPDFGGGAVNSIWYEWVAPASQLVRASACGSEAFASVGVYTGNAVNALAGAGINDGRCLQNFNAVAGTSYKIALDGDGSEDVTDLDLRVLNPPANDLFANAVALPGSGSIAINGTTVDATREAGETDPNFSGGSVWYTWTPANSGVAAFSTCTYAGDPTLTVYTGATVPTLTTIVGNDDACGLGSGVSFNAVAGTTYRISVAGLGGESSEGTFTLRNVSAQTGSSGDPGASNPVIPVNPVTPVTPAKKCKKGFKKVKGKCKKSKKKKKK